MPRKLWVSALLMFIGAVLVIWSAATAINILEGPFRVAFISLAARLVLLILAIAGFNLIIAGILGLDPK